MIQTMTIKIDPRTNTRIKIVIDSTGHEMITLETPTPETMGKALFTG